MATVKIAYAASSAIVCAASTDATWRQSTAIDNTSNLYDDALVLYSVSTGTVTGNKQAIVYVYAGVGTTYEGSATGTDGQYNATTAPVSLAQAYVVPTPVTGTTGTAVAFGVAQFYGGVLPPKWGVIVQLDGTGACSTTINYTGITYTVA